MENVKVPKRSESTLGKHYERYVFALISLKCLLDSNIKDFWVASNLSEIEKFDDVVLHVEFKNGTKEVFLIQIKHKKNCDKPVLADMLSHKQKDLSLKLHQEAYIKLTNNKETLKLIDVDENTKMNLIFLNNCKIDLRNGNKLLEFEEISSTNFRSFLSTRNYEDSSGYQIIDKSENLDPEFLNKFYFYPEQYDTEDIQKQIQELLGVNLSVKEIQQFFYQYTEENPNNLKLTKLHIKMKVLSSIFGHFKVPELNPNNLSLMKTIKKFHVTLISDNESEELLWSEILYYLQDLFAEHNINFLEWDKTLSVETQDRIKQFFSFLPNETISVNTLYFHAVAISIVPFYKIITSRSTDINIYNLLANLNVFTVVKQTEIEPLVFPETLKIFRTMDDLDPDSYNENAEQIYLSFRNKKKVSLALLNLDRDVRKYISSNQFVQLMKSTVSISYYLENGDETYINRKLERSFIEEKVLLNENEFLMVICNCNTTQNIRNIQEKLSRNYICATYGASSYEFFLDSNKIEEMIAASSYRLISDLISIEEIFVDGFYNILDSINIKEFSNLWVTKEPYSANILKEIKSMKGNREIFYILKYEGESDQKIYFSLIHTNGNIDIFRKYIYKETLHDHEMINEVRFSNVNIICNIAGMGKSMLLRYLLKMFPNDEWLVYVELNKYIHLLNKLKTFEDLIEFLFNNCLVGTTVSSSFLDSFKALFEYYIRNGKLVLLVDDFEVITNKNTLSIFKEATEMGLRLWILARPSRKEEYKNYFGTFAFELVEFSAKDQQKFFRKFFKQKEYKWFKIKTALKAISTITKNLENSFIGICQQTMMLAEVLYSNPNKHKMKTHELYEEFIKITIANHYSKNSDFILRTLSKIALTIFFTKSVLKKVFDWSEFECDIEVFKKENSKYPFVEFTKDGQAIFNHRTYAEFLAARWISHNVKKQLLNETPFNLRELVELLYSRELTNVRWFFDNIIWSMEKKKYIFEFRSSKIMYTTDILGRSEFHYSMTYGEQFYIQTSSEIAEKIDLKEEHARIEETKTHILLRVPENLVKNQFQMPFKNYKLITIETHNYNTNNYNLKNYADVLKNNAGDEKTVKKLALFEKMALVKNISSDELKYLVLLQPDDFLNLNPLKCAGLAGCLKNVEEMLGFDFIFSFMQNISELEESYFLLYHSVKNGFINILKKLLSSATLRRKLDMVRDDTQMSLLHLAVKYRQEECIQELLNVCLPHQFGQDIFGNTALHLAGDWDNVNILKMFTTSSVLDFLNLTNNKGESILYSYTQHKNITCIKYLLKYISKTCIDAPENERGMTALHLAALQGNIECIQELIKCKADINCKNNIGFTPLITTARRGLLKIIRLLLESNAKINYCDKNKWTALHHAVKTGNIKVADVLLSMKADVNSVNKKGNTPLIIACINNNPKMVETLLNYKPNIIHVSKSKKTAASICKEKQYVECLRKLENYEQDRDLANTFSLVSSLQKNHHRSKGSISLNITKKRRRAKRNNGLEQRKRKKRII